MHLVEKICGQCPEVSLAATKSKVMLIDRALYDLKSSVASWRHMLSQTLLDLGYESSRVDPYLWLKPENKPYGSEYYAYVLVYGDETLHVRHDPSKFMKSLEEIYRLKEEDTESTIYLGANAKKFQLKD